MATVVTKHAARLLLGIVVLILGCAQLSRAPWARHSPAAKAGASAAQPAAAEEPAQAVKLFDARPSSSAPLPGEALNQRAGWSRLPEDRTRHSFRGDAVLLNHKLAIVLRRKGPGAEVYASGAKGLALRAVLAPSAGGTDARLTSVAIAKNTANAVALDATFKAADGKTQGIRYELGMGQVFVKAEPRKGAAALRVDAPCRFVVMPDFFADDIVVDAAEIPVDQAELPCENFLLHFLGNGEAIALTIATAREEDIRVTLSGQKPQRVIRRSEIPFGKDGKVFVAVLECPGIWHTRDVAKEEADKIIPLDWKAPFPAQWRVDWRQENGLNDSWEMLAQKPDGTYEKLDWFGQSDRVGTPDWMKDNRQRWTTVLGSFKYPCWVDKDGQGFFQPLKKVSFVGPTLLYPINRVSATPLDRYSLVDIVRETLGVGPCEYVLDVEGQKKVARGAATCATKGKLDGIYSKKEQKEKRAEVEKGLDDVLAFVRLVRDRIEGYNEFGHKLVAYLEEQKKPHPELAEFLTQMQTVARTIDTCVQRRKDAIRPQEDATRLVDEFRTTLVGYEGTDALERCKKITKAIVGIGGAQDELVGECRVAVKVLRQRAGLAMAMDPRTVPVAKEIRRRTHEILRSPAGYEAPRH